MEISLLSVKSESDGVLNDTQVARRDWRGSIWQFFTGQSLKKRHSSYKTTLLHFEWQGSWHSKYLCPWCIDSGNGHRLCNCMTLLFRKDFNERRFPTQLYYTCSKGLQKQKPIYEILTCKLKFTPVGPFTVSWPLEEGRYGSLNV